MGVAKIINKNDTAANLASENPVLDAGVVGYATDTHILKIGDGSTAWNDLEGVRIANNEIRLGSMIMIPKYICYPASLCFMADYQLDTVLDATYGKGVLTGTGYNAPVVFDGMLDLAGGYLAGIYVDYAGDGGNATTALQQGCVRFNYLPVYQGTFEKSFKLFGIFDSNSSLKNLIELYLEEDTGYLTVFIYDKDGESICSEVMGALEVVGNQWYEVELNWDITSGETRLFIDGQQFGGTITEGGTRDSNIHKIRVGNGYNPTNYYSEFKIDKFKIFDQVMHITNYTPGGYDDEVLVLPLEFADFIPSTGGNVNNEESPYNGFPIANMSLVHPDVLFAWKILD